MVWGNNEIFLTTKISRSTVYVEVCAHLELSDMELSSLLPTYMQVPSSDVNTESDQTLQLFLKQIPVLQFVGIPHLIDSTYKLKIDNETQLVCKYLNALKSDAIDQIYIERKCKY